MEDCVFCKIVKGEIPTDFVYQDEEIAVFADIHPSAPIHLLFIPKEHVEDLAVANDKLVLKIKKHILEKVEELDLQTKGYRVLVNGGTAKGVYHLHFHLLGEVTKDKAV